MGQSTRSDRNGEDASSNPGVAPKMGKVLRAGQKAHAIRYETAYVSLAVAVNLPSGC